MNDLFFEKTNLSWIVDYDYERSACTCDDYICRCTTIERAWATKVDVNGVVEKLYSKYGGSDSAIDRYCFDRICHAFKIYDKDLYEVETGYGYYGQEVYGVYFEDEEKIFNEYKEMISLDTDLEKVWYCLMLEYGYLLETVESAKCANVVDVSSRDIHLPQFEYLKKVDREVIEAYKNRKLPIAVCIKDDDKYRLIDGYHRFVANKNNEEVSIIVLN